MNPTPTFNGLTIDTEMNSDDDMPTLALESPSPMPNDSAEVPDDSPMLPSTSTANVSISPPARKKSVKQVRKTSVPVVMSPKSPDVKPDIKPSLNNGGSIELKNRMTKDPNAPRYPSTSYTLFLAERRAAEVAAHPDLKAFEISRIMGEKWRLVSDEDKVPYVEKAAKLKKEYEAAIKIYNKTDESKNWIKFQREKNKNSNVKSSGKKKRKLKNGDEEKDEIPHIDDIPIFSQAFLTYNKEQDRKLRQIRLKTGEVADEQNGLRKRLAMLQKHAARHSVNEDGGRLDELHAQVVDHLSSISSSIKTTVKWLPKNVQTLSTTELVEVALKSPVRRKFMLDLELPPQ